MTIRFSLRLTLVWFCLKTNSSELKMTDQIVEINRKDWPKLKELYTPDGVKSYIAYTTIDNYIRWFDQDPNTKHVKFYCLNGDFSDGTFVVTVSDSLFYYFKLYFPVIKHIVFLGSLCGICRYNQ